MDFKVHDRSWTVLKSPKSNDFSDALGCEGYLSAYPNEQIKPGAKQNVQFIQLRSSRLL